MSLILWYAYRAAGLSVLMYSLLAFVYFLTAAHSAASLLLLLPVCIHSNGSNLVSLNPNFVTGFSDAESCFFLLDFTQVRNIKQAIKFKLFSRLVYIIMILHYYLKFKVTLAQEKSVNMGRILFTFVSHLPRI